MLKSTSKLVSASQLITPISLAGDVTLSTGNLVIGTSGKGIDFSATSSGSGTMTSELLADYEEGTFTPTDGSGAGLTFTAANGFYTKVGRAVTVTFRVTYPVTVSTSATTIDGLPFTSMSAATSTNGVAFGYTNYGTGLIGRNPQSAATIIFEDFLGVALTNANVSGKQFRGTVTYFV